METGDIISCNIDGTIVEGKVNISPKDLYVKLIGTGLALSASAHLMLMAPVIYTTEPYGKALANERGVMRLKELLVGLHHDYLIIRQNEETIVGRIPQYKEMIRMHDDAMKAIRERRRVAKCCYKSGTIDQRSYMNQVDDMKSEARKLDFQLRRDFDKLFGDILSKCSHSENLQDAILHLDR